MVCEKIIWGYWSTSIASSNLSQGLNTVCSYRVSRSKRYEKTCLQTRLVNEWLITHITGYSKVCGHRRTAQSLHLWLTTHTESIETLAMIYCFHVHWEYCAGQMIYYVKSVWSLSQQAFIYMSTHYSPSAVSRYWYDFRSECSLPDIQHATHTY
jgi:hypothetical protein